MSDVTVEEELKSICKSCGNVRCQCHKCIGSFKRCSDGCEMKETFEHFENCKLEWEKRNKSKGGEMMSKHTLGPWTYDKDQTHVDRVNPQIGSPEDYVCEVYRNCPEYTANAKLIAAAPEMLDVLKKFVTYFGGAEMVPELQFKIDGAKAAIKKAT